MSVKIQAHVWSALEPQKLERLILLAMADAANDDGWCWISVATIGRKTRLSERYIRELIGRLHTAGHVRVYGRYDSEQGRQTSNAYFIEHGQLAEPVVPPDLRGVVARRMVTNLPVKRESLKDKLNGKDKVAHARKSRAGALGTRVQGGTEIARIPPMNAISDESLLDPPLAQEHLLDTSDDVPNIITGGSDKPNISLVPKAEPSAKTGKTAAELEAWRNAVCDALLLPRELAVSVINQYLCLLCHITTCKGQWASMRLAKPIATLDEMAEFGKYVRRRMDERNVSAPRRPEVLTEWGADFKAKPSKATAWINQQAVE